MSLTKLVKTEVYNSFNELLSLFTLVTSLPTGT